MLTVVVASLRTCDIRVKQVQHQCISYVTQTQYITHKVLAHIVYTTGQQQQKQQKQQPPGFSGRSAVKKRGRALPDFTTIVRDSTQRLVPTPPQVDREAAEHLEGRDAALVGAIRETLANTKAALEEGGKANSNANPNATANAVVAGGGRDGLGGMSPLAYDQQQVPSYFAISP